MMDRDEIQFNFVSGKGTADPMSNYLCGLTNCHHVTKAYSTHVNMEPPIHECVKKQEM